MGISINIIAHYILWRNFDKFWGLFINEPLDTTRVF